MANPKAKQTSRSARAKGDVLQRECERVLIERLGKTIGACEWSESSSRSGNYDLDSVGSILGALSPEEAEWLCRMGLLESTNKEVSAAELLRFLEEHGERWFQLRLEKQIESLQASIARAKRRADFVSGTEVGQ